MSGDQTFDDLWMATGMADRTGANDETLREPPHSFTARGTGLPHLSIGAELDERGSSGVQLIIQKLLGEGGMGMVHLARQPLLDRDVAIKRVRPDAPRAAADSLFREARYMGSLEHPNILPVHALGADSEGRPILVMKCIDGVPWRTLIAQPDHPAWERWTGWASDPFERNIEILIDVCRAVAYAHDNGILHRDLKPDNIMLGEHGEVYVLDWGIATRLDRPRVSGVVGTPAYMAPEMVDPDGPLSPATDVYLLGSCMHEVLTGVPPHAGRSLKEVLAKAHLSASPALIGVPNVLAEICRKALAADPADRFAAPDALRESLMTWLRTRGSVVLSTAASQKLDHLHQLLGTPDPDVIAVSSAFTASHFGFGQALDSWSDNPEAKAGLQSARRLMATFQILRENLDHAETLIADIDEPGDLPAKLAAGRERQAERLRMARDQDWQLNARERVIFWAVFGVFGTTFTVAILTNSFSDPSQYTVGDLVVFAAVFWSVTAVLIAAGRKWLYSNSINAAITNSVLAVGLMILSNRLLHWQFLDTDVSTVLAFDALLVGACVSTMKTIVGWTAWAYTVGCIAVAAVILTFPEHGLNIFGVALAIAVCMSGFYWHLISANGASAISSGLGDREQNRGPRG